LKALEETANGLLRMKDIVGDSPRPRCDGKDEDESGVEEKRWQRRQ